MKEIDLSKLPDGTKAHTYYYGVPQPMYSCDSTEDWKKIRGEKVFVVEGLDELSKYLNTRESNGDNLYDGVYRVYKWNEELWIKIPEKWVPDCWSTSNQIIYKIDDNGQMIPTDATYIRVMVLRHYGSRVALYTSSGVYNVALGAWRLSAAVKLQFRHEQSAPNVHKKYDQKLGEIINRTKYTMKDMRVFNLVFNPQSKMFGQFHTAARRVFPEIRKDDVKKYLTSKAVVSMITKELAIMIPELKTGMLNHFTPEKTAKMFDTMFETAVSKGTTDDQRNVMRDILQVAYKEEVEGYKSDVPLVGGVDKVSSLPQTASPSSIDIENYDEKTSVSIPLMTEEEEKEKLRLDRIDTGSVEGYIADGN